MDLIEVAKVFGFPCACLAALALAVWRIAVWFGTHIAEPLAAAHIQAMAAQTNAIQTISTKVEAIDAKLDKVTDVVIRITAATPNSPH
jgi:hypothetical protein